MFSRCIFSAASVSVASGPTSSACVLITSLSFMTASQSQATQTGVAHGCAGFYGLRLPHRHRPQVVTPAFDGDTQFIARHAMCSPLASRPTSRTYPWITSSFLAGPRDATCHVPCATRGLPRICYRPPPVHLKSRIGTEHCATCMQPVFRRILESVERISSACAQVARLSHGSETPSGPWRAGSS
jgi:hypothetical protein